MKFTLQFTMANAGNVPIYRLIFATKHIKGIQSMKEAMNRVSHESDKQKFSSFKINKNEIIWTAWKNDQDNVLAADYIFNKFKGKTIKVGHAENGDESIEDFVLLETPFVFRKGQLGVMFNRKQIKFNHSFPSKRMAFNNDAVVTVMAENEEVGYEYLQDLIGTLDNKGEEKTIEGDSYLIFKAKDVSNVFKHTVLSVIDDSKEIKFDSYLKDQMIGQFICLGDDQHKAHKSCLIGFPQKA